MRGHLLTTTGKKLEDVGVRDFLDIVFSYAINTPESRVNFREAFMGYAFDYKFGKQLEEDKTFSGFTTSALNMMDDLDAFTSQLG